MIFPLQSLLPEIVLTVAAVAIYLGGAFFETRRPWPWVAGVAILLAAAALAWPEAHATLDGLAWGGRWLALGLGSLLVLTNVRPRQAEYVGSLLLGVVGLMLVAAADDLVLLFVALELIAIPTYVLLYLGRKDAENQEATAKYFFLSVLASAILLYGFSFLYGTAGSTDLSAVRAAIDGAGVLSAGLKAFVPLAAILVLAGLCFKITAVPFHFYAPDVYQGTTNTNAALLSTLPKAAGFVVLVRLFVAVGPSEASYLWQVVLVISMLTMTVGNVTALWQDNLRRLLAYSSIAQAGYMLIALAVAVAAGGADGPWNGAAAVAFYLVVYAVATIGVFAALEHLGGADRTMGTVDALAGLARSRPGVAAMLAVCLFSLTGIPPLAGFWGKFLVFGGALAIGGPWFLVATVLGLLNAAIAAAYYLRVVAAMYFRPSAGECSVEGRTPAWWAAVVCTALTVGIGVYPWPLVRAASRSVPRAGQARPLHETSRCDFNRRAATPTCPATWNGGFNESSCPNGLNNLALAGIIEDACDN